MNDWCGEHFAVQQVEPAMVKLPVYDIQTDMVVQPPMKKKPGRKPKHDQTPA
jgi:hypothetical protein